MKTILYALIISLAAAISGQAADYLQAFPPAGEGMVRYVLHLPPEKDESLLKVELIVGKTVAVDKDNRYFFSGKIEEEVIAGWGFTRYSVSELGPMAGTLMAIDPDIPKVNRFVPLGGGPYLLRYNSQLPVVVYVPVDAEVRYRIWRTAAKSKLLKKG